MYILLEHKARMLYQGLLLEQWNLNKNNQAALKGCDWNMQLVD